MKEGSLILFCWECRKEYPPSIYPPFSQENKLVLCECGGQIVSRSGKILLGYAEVQSEKTSSARKIERN